MMWESDTWRRHYNAYWFDLADKLSDFLRKRELGNTGKISMKMSFCSFSCCFFLKKLHKSSFTDKFLLLSVVNQATHIHYLIVSVSRNFPWLNWVLRFTAYHRLQLRCWTRNAIWTRISSEITAREGMLTKATQWLLATFSLLINILFIGALPDPWHLGPLPYDGLHHQSG